MPAHYTTVAAYIRRMYAKGTESTDNMRSYLSSVDAVHEMAGYQPPTAHSVTLRMRKGHLRRAATTAGVMPSFAVPSPAHIVLEDLRLGGPGAPPEVRRF